MKIQRFFRSISQEELACRIGVDQPTISKIEGNKAKETPRTIRIRKAIAEFFGVPVESIFFPESEKR
ncbi:MAG: helix-turn-helix transcriptional regulator [Candidatus Aminicenantes bacterium]|nr:helix-turn-helix transcriptional regulator [Candidatus Aminicenantes bacterium]